MFKTVISLYGTQPVLTVKSGNYDFGGGFETLTVGQLDKLIERLTLERATMRRIEGALK